MFENWGIYSVYLKKKGTENPQILFQNNCLNKGVNNDLK